MRRTFLSVLAILVSVSNFGQQENYKQGEAFLQDGIYLENLKLNIPWFLEVKDLPKYGNPAIARNSKKRLTVLWDTVTILDGVKAFLIYHSRRLRNGSYTKLTRIEGGIDTADILRVVNTIENYSKRPCKVRKVRKKFIEYYWRFEDCYFSITKGRHFGLLYIAKARKR